MNFQFRKRQKKNIADVTTKKKPAIALEFRHQSRRLCHATSWIAMQNWRENASYTFVHRQTTTINNHKTRLFFYLWSLFDRIRPWIIAVAPLDSPGAKRASCVARIAANVSNLSALRERKKNHKNQHDALHWSKKISCILNKKHILPVVSLLHKTNHMKQRTKKKNKYQGTIKTKREGIEKLMTNYEPS